MRRPPAAFSIFMARLGNGSMTIVDIGAGNRRAQNPALSGRGERGIGRVSDEFESLPLLPKPRGNRLRQAVVELTHLAGTAAQAVISNAREWQALESNVRRSYFARSHSKPQSANFCGRESYTAPWAS